MEPSIRPVAPEPALRGRAPRRGGPRRRRDEAGEFAEELERGEEAAPREREPGAPARATNDDLSVAPPAEGEAGTHLDVVG